MNKNISKLVSVGAVLAGSLFISWDVNASFYDVDENHYYFDAVDYADVSDIVNGFSDGSFRPYNYISRAEFTKIIVNSSFTEGEISGCTENSFPDITNEYKFLPYICIAKARSIINGYSDGLFYPDSTISIGEASKIISNAYGLTSENYDGDNKFKPYIDALSIKQAIPVTFLGLDNPIERGEMVEIIYRLDNDIKNKESKTYLELIGEVVKVTPEPSPTSTPIPTPAPINPGNFDFTPEKAGWEEERYVDLDGSSGVPMIVIHDSEKLKVVDLSVHTNSLVEGNVYYEYNGSYTILRISNLVYPQSNEVITFDMQVSDWITDKVYITKLNRFGIDTLRDDDHYIIESQVEYTDPDSGNSYYDVTIYDNPKYDGPNWI